jgi:hypothetical protein
MVPVKMAARTMWVTRQAAAAAVPMAAPVHQEQMPRLALEDKAAQVRPARQAV